MSKSYDDIIKKMRQVKPVPEHPEDLTHEIMNRLYRQKADRPGIQIHSGKWNLFIRFRTAMAAAAIFLIGLFIFQQWEIMRKVSDMEKEMLRNKSSLENIASIRSERLNQIIKLQLEKENINSKVLKNPEKLMSEKDFIFFIQVYRQLLEENKPLREQILQEFSNLDEDNKENKEYKL